ncbi:MAG: hypothetical protein PHC39_04770 [Proteiniphilum sp.]|nr:hypothetical protein [Proteiniphilum sp.]
MKDKSIHIFTKNDADRLAYSMGFCPRSLDRYIGRYVEIRLKSPKKLVGVCGAVYRNGESGAME